MSNLRRTSLLAAFLVFAFGVGGESIPSAALRPLSFLSGRWVSETPGEVQEETWSPVSGESMVGSFRIVQHDRPVFYEFWVLELDNNRPVLKLKHFNADLVGWEEKNASTKMPLVKTAEDDAIFAEADSSVSLHYHRVGKKLTCIVHHVRDGKGSDETFTLMRATRRD